MFTQPSLQALYNASQAHAEELESRLDTQKLRTTQLEVELAAAQSHIAELSAILKSAVGSASSPVHVRSPVTQSLSQESSAAETIPRLRSQELQGGALPLLNCNACMAIVNLPCTSHAPREFAYVLCDNNLRLPVPLHDQ